MRRHKVGAIARVVRRRDANVSGALLWSEGARPEVEFGEREGEILGSVARGGGGLSSETAVELR